MELKPGTLAYEEHAKAEMAHYNRVFTSSGTLFQPVPASWVEVERRAAELIRKTTGADLTGHVVSRLRQRPGVRLLSLGSGPGGLELALSRAAPDAEIVAIDFNEDLLAKGKEQASSEGLNVRFERGDLNDLVLPQKTFDLVLCHASLHHVIELERLTQQIKNTLLPGGKLLTVDIITANGYQMRDETRLVVRRLWQTLPLRYRLNHTAYSEPKLDEAIWEADTSESGMECIRSQDILTVLADTFIVESFVPYFSIVRRFLDTMYGPNYDLDKPLDRALLDWIWELDLHYLSSGQLQPETFFGIYSV